MIAATVTLCACGEDGTTIVGKTDGEKAAARSVAEDHTSGNDGSEEAPSRVDCRRTGTSVFPIPAGQKAEGVYRCVAKFPDGFTEECEVDAGSEKVGCAPKLPVDPAKGAE